MFSHFFKLFFSVFVFCLFFLPQTQTVFGETSEDVKEIQKTQRKQSNEIILSALATNSYKFHILPRYKNLLEDSTALNNQIKQFCSAPSSEGLEIARERFKETVLSFAAIEHVHFGPIVESYRLERFLYWPDHKGRGLRAVRRLIASKDLEALSPEKFADKSVALQGLAALEYVLYQNDKSTTFESLFSDDDLGRYRCTYALRISDNIQTISHEVYSGWRDKNKLVTEFLKPEQTNEHYRKRSEVLLELYHSVVVEMKKIHDFKLKALYGLEVKRLKPKRAPFWRSGLSLKVLKRNIDAIDHFVAVSGFKSLLDKTPIDLQFHVSKRFEEIYSILDNFEKRSLTVFDVLQDDQSLSDLKTIAKTVSHLNVGFARYFAIAANLPLGFNASDGD